MKSLVIISVIAFLAILNEGEGFKNLVPLSTMNSVNKCPKVGPFAAVYQVVDILKTPPKILKFGGCAFLDSNKTDFTKNYFMMWIGSLENSEQRCREPGSMSRIEFSCNKDRQLPHNYVGTMYEQLLATVSDYDGHYYEIGPPLPDRRCAIHDMVKGSNDTTFRMAISQDISCISLADIMKTRQPNKLNEKAMLLQLNRTKFVIDTASLHDWYEINDILKSKNHYFRTNSVLRTREKTELRRLHRSP